MPFKVSTFALIFVAGLAVAAAAQTPNESGPVVIGAQVAGAAPLSAKPGMITMRISDMDAEPAKGAPFCANITTEHTQNFADGNRIHTSDSSTLCRDSEGRTRREATLNLLGAAPQNSAPKLVSIDDPVAGVHYMLDSENKVAHRTVIGHSQAAMSADHGLAPSSEHVTIIQRVGPGGPGMVANENVFFKKAASDDEPAPVSENLGDQTIEGLRATGTRITTTIPVGKMGNEQPISVTSERWYSPDLKATVMTKHNDPWAGELKSQFTNINTSEPDASLFSVPADYKVVDDKFGPFVMQKQLPPLPSPPPQ